MNTEQMFWTFFILVNIRYAAIASDLINLAVGTVWVLALAVVTVVWIREG